MKTIVWDIDDVLNNLMESWFENLKKRKCIVLAYKDIVENPPNQIIGITMDEYLQSLDQFRNSKQGIQMVPNPVILNWFKTHGSKFRHVALTSRSRQTVPLLGKWLFTHFGDWIRTMSFIPSFRNNEDLPCYDKDKKQFLEWLGKTDFFIDDSPHNIQAAESIGIKAFLYPQPWNNRYMSVEGILNKLLV